ncbi:MAG: glycosyltransferase [Burkholderiales bacterium]
MRPQMAFVSPVFMFPNDTGGRIRTTNILRGLKDGAFDVTLLCPASDEQKIEWADELRTVCDHLVAWRPPAKRPRWIRAFDLFAQLPVSVTPDQDRNAQASVLRSLTQGSFDVAVFDFVHASVLLPAQIDMATVCFTHNVEAEIFARHAAQASRAAMRYIWTKQHAKMRRFEGRSLKRFTSVIAVSERDASQFRESYEIAMPTTIPTGVDLDYFAWQAPPAIEHDHPPTVAFVGSMDWDANIDGVRHFLMAVWPLIQNTIPESRFTVIGRNPPATLLDAARNLKGVSFTGFVDDVRPYMRQAHVSVIPLRVGGGTRIKAFEAMAMGCPIVSTSIGIEGLDVIDGEHYMRRDSPADQAAGVIELLRDATLRNDISRRARRCVEENFGHRVAARVFEEACLSALAMHADSKN